MNTPLDEVLALTHEMLNAALVSDWTEFENLREQRARLFKPGLYASTGAPYQLPQLDDMEKQLAAIFGDDNLALNEASELLGPMRDASPFMQPPATGSTP